MAIARAAIVAEDVLKKIMAEEVWKYQYTHDYKLVMETYKLANEERIFEKEMEKESPPAKRAKFGTKAMPIDPLAEFIDLCVDICQ